MSRIDGLIQQYCPDGVEFKPLSSICSIKGRVGWQRLTKAEYRSEGDYFLVTGTDFLNNNTIDFNHCHYVDKDRYDQDPNIQLKENDVLLTKDGTIGKVAIINTLDKPATLNSHLVVIRNFTGELLPRFLLHILKSSVFMDFAMRNCSRGTIMGLPQNVIASFPIPVPPLPVQEEIVRILDKFTELETELEIELETELEMRQKQYEYYREKYISNTEGVKCKLGDVCAFLRGPFGGSLKKDCFKPEGYAVYEQQHAIYNSLDFRYFVDENKFKELKRFQVKPNDLIVSCSGTIGRVFIIPSNAPVGIINQALLKLTPSEKILPEFLKILFESHITSKLNEVSYGGAIKNVPPVTDLKTLEIILPSLDKQKEIVNLMNKFSALSIEISEGLPTEINMRHQQYEYYRDKLLTFKRLEDKAV